LVEPLETRTLPAAPGWLGQVASLGVESGHSVLGSARLLSLQQLQITGAPTPAFGAWVNGVIATGSPDVDWYSFTLSSAATVKLTSFDPLGSHFASTLSLYNTDPDARVDNSVDNFNNGNIPFPIPNDPYDPLGHRLLTQVQGTTAGGTSLVWQLAAGTYYVAVSGAGNRYFNPFVADSGLAGSSGAYQLAIEADNLPSTIGPKVLEPDITQNAVYSTSPLVLRVDFSKGLDPNTITANTVQLLWSTDGSFGAGTVSIALRMHFSPDANELQLTPSAPLQAGYYRLVLKGTGSEFLTDLAGDPLGQINWSGSGSDAVWNFRVTGSEGSATNGLAGNDTMGTAHFLGNVTSSGLVQVAGAIGDDPYYSFFDPSNSDPSSPSFQLPSNYAGADVDLYHFQISGPGSYIVLAEVFAGRIGSPLDSGLSLFKVVNGQLVLVTANDNTMNGLIASDPTIPGGYSGEPLFNDSTVNAGLTAGDYYLAVSSGANTPDALLGRAQGVDPVFDPNFAHSGDPGFGDFNGFTTGSYVLNLRVAPNPGAPHVISVSPSNNLTPISPPTQLVIRFDQAMNLQQLAYQAYLTTTQYLVSSVYVHGSDGRDYFPRLINYDPNTFTATFQMLDPLPNGFNILHLSGAYGLTNLGGTPLAGNSPGGDFLAAIQVQGSPQGTPGSSLVFQDHEPNNTPATPQDLGVLFPRMQQAGISVVRNAGNSVSDTADYYGFTVTQGRLYNFTLSGANLPPGIAPILTTTSGVPIPTSTVFLSGGVATTAFLQPGTYLVQIGGWSSTQAASVAYRLYIAIGQVGENPTPLLVGAAPALSIRLVNSSTTGTSLVSLSNGSGISPASLSTISGLPSLVNLLPSSLLANGVVGGVQANLPGNTALAGGNNAPTSPFALVRDMLDLMVLTQLNGTADESADPPLSSIMPMNWGFGGFPWGQAVDFLYRFTEWLGGPLGAVAPGAVLPPVGSQEPEAQDADMLEARCESKDAFDDSFRVEDSTWMSAVAALALVQVDHRRRKSRRAAARQADEPWMTNSA
jgi:hypothetical protein